MYEVAEFAIMYSSNLRQKKKKHSRESQVLFIYLFFQFHPSKRSKMSHLAVLACRCNENHGVQFEIDCIALDK